jgi:hypothetical protein
MESLTIPVSVLGAPESDLPLAGELAGICIWAAMSMVENVRNAMVSTTARLVFISIPLFWFG